MWLGFCTELYAPVVLDAIASAPQDASVVFMTTVQALALRIHQEANVPTVLVHLQPQQPNLQLLHTFSAVWPPFDPRRTVGRQLTSGGAADGAAESHQWAGALAAHIYSRCSCSLQTRIACCARYNYALCSRGKQAGLVALAFTARSCVHCADAALLMQETAFALAHLRVWASAKAAPWRPSVPAITRQAAMQQLTCNGHGQNAAGRARSSLQRPRSARFRRRCFPSLSTGARECTAAAHGSSRGQTPHSALVASSTICSACTSRRLRLHTSSAAVRSLSCTSALAPCRVRHSRLQRSPQSCCRRRASGAQTRACCCMPALQALAPPRRPRTRRIARLWKRGARSM